MQGRDTDEAHRAATPLELLYDLSFVVAIALAGSELHHAVLAGHLGAGLLGYLTTFVALWWAWMSFTWFASAYDTDDAPFRINTMFQMGGVLVLAAGVESASAGDFTTVTIGYVVMRVGLVMMWLRVAREHAERRRTALRQVAGISIVQALWVARLALPATAAWGYGSWALLMACELAVPMWAARAGYLPWHAHHIAERYGLFTIIVLGECVLGATQAVTGVIHVGGWTWDVVGVGFGSTALVFALWWVYFLVPFGEALHHHRARVQLWAYGHVVVFASLAAMGAFLGVIADLIESSEPGHASPVLAIGLVASAVAIYLTTMWGLGVHVVGGPTLRLGWVWGAALGLLAAVVAGVAAGMPLPWALPALAVAPVVVIAGIRRMRGRDLDAAERAPKQRGRHPRRA